MHTSLFSLNNGILGAADLQSVIDIIRRDGTVVIPTETVYGLAANALSSDAIQKIFIAKGRPSDNPLIVHIASENDISHYVQMPSKQAQQLMAHFWPGPLTLICQKKENIPPSVTAGRNTVAIRVPANPVMIQCIEASGVPLAAPSANISTRPSATDFRSVYEDLYGKVDAIIDGGVCDLGLESTVVDVTVSPFVILRPGYITQQAIEAVIGEQCEIFSSVSHESVVKSPGMKYKHYAPHTPLTVISGDTSAEILKHTKRLIAQFEKNNKKVLLMSTVYTDSYDTPYHQKLGSDLHDIARNLFMILRNADHMEIDHILFEPVPKQGIGIAIMNRLEKAAQKE